MANKEGCNAHDYKRFSKTQTSFAETSAKFNFNKINQNKQKIKYKVILLQNDQIILKLNKSISIIKCWSHYYKIIQIEQNLAKFKEQKILFSCES